jgi:hypothetical protein
VFCRSNIASQDFEIKVDTKLVTLQLAIIPDLYQINISGHVFDDENQVCTIGLMKKNRFQNVW